MLLFNGWNCDGEVWFLKGKELPKIKLSLANKLNLEEICYKEGDTYAYFFDPNYQEYELIGDEVSALSNIVSNSSYLTKNAPTERMIQKAIEYFDLNISPLLDEAKFKNFDEFFERNTNKDLKCILVKLTDDILINPNKYSIKKAFSIIPNNYRNRFIDNYYVVIEKEVTDTNFIVIVPKELKGLFIGKAGINIKKICQDLKIRRLQVI